MASQQRRIQPGEWIIPALTLLFVLLYFVQTRDGSMVALRWPIIIAVVLACLWVLVCFSLFLGPKVKNLHKTLEARKLVRLLYVLCVPLALLVSMPYLGFTLGTFLFLAVFFRLLQVKSWSATLGVAFLMAASLHVSLIICLHMPLPRLVIGSFQL